MPLSSVLPARDAAAPSTEALAAAAVATAAGTAGVDDNKTKVPSNTITGMQLFPPSGALRLRDAELQSARAMARDGCIDAQRKLGHHFYVVGNFAEARLFYTKAALEDPSAMCQLGVMAIQGQGGPADDEEAARWFLQAAKKGSPRGMYNISVCLHQGCGIERNEAQAMTWLTEAARAGHDVASNLVQRVEAARQDCIARQIAQSPIPLSKTNLQKIVVRLPEVHLDRRFELEPSYSRRMLRYAMHQGPGCCFVQ